MNCMHCGTLLPPGALFCGECGRRVASAGETASVRRPASGPQVPAAPAPELQGPPVTPRTGAVGLPEDFDFSGPPVKAGRAESATTRSKGRAAAPSAASSGAAAPAPVTTPAQPTHDEPRCEQCGHLMAPGDIFCGECGFVSRAVSQKFSRRGASAPAAGPPITPSVIIPSLPTRPIDIGPDIDPELLLTGEPAPWLAASKSRPASRPASKPASRPAAPASAPASASADAPPADAESAESHRHIAPPLAPHRHIAPAAEPHHHVAPPPAETIVPSVSSQARAAASVDDDDVEATRIVARPGGAKFVLQFSTGESVTVNGSGLLGRNPRPEPGEFFDQLVRVLDAGRSVSKTHLEFGQEGGMFWVRDRFSGNGTVVREPDATPRRCDADKRYSVARGSRVDIGEQFFVVS